MTISLPLKHRKVLIMSLNGISSYYMSTTMSVYKKLSSAYTKIEISHPYILLSDDQFALLDDNMDRSTIQYDQIYVRPPRFCCSDVPTRIAISTLLNILRPCHYINMYIFYTIIILLYMLVWLPPMTSSSS